MGGRIFKNAYRLPNSNGVYLLGATSGIGTNLTAGLPDIEGQFFHLAGYTSGYFALIGYFQTTSLEGGGGAFYGKETGSNTYFRANGTLVYDKPVLATAFKASKSNSIYGNASTVQPASLKVSGLIKHD